MNILYILNHKTLSDFELPILISMGYGIYIPKIYSSISDTDTVHQHNHFTYDSSLKHISVEDKDILDQFDFFNNTQYNNHSIQLIADNFDIIITTVYMNTDVTNRICERFHGMIYYRFFGREADKRYQPSLLGLHENNYNKIKYIFSYQEIISFERQFQPLFFTNENTLHIPLGVPDLIFDKYESTYNPLTKDTFVFVCSKIEDCPYYTNIYHNLNQYLGDFNFTILGKNNEHAFDNRIKNNLPDDEYYREMSQHLAMYYHGTEPRHLHYHPLEAIVIGLPIIFHSNSLLATSYLPDSPGICNDYGEVRLKLTRLINGDMTFRDTIIAYQNTIKTLLRTSYCLSHFRKLIDS